MVKTFIATTTTLVAAFLTMANAQTAPPSGGLSGLPISQTLPKACTDSLATNALALFGPCKLAAALPVLTTTGGADAYLKAIDGLMQNQEFLTGLCSQECTQAMTSLSEKSTPACGTAPILSLNSGSMTPGPTNATDPILAAANKLGLADLVNTGKFAQAVVCPKADDNKSFCLANRWAAFRTAYPDASTLDLTKVLANDKVVCDGCVKKMHDVAAAQQSTANLPADVANAVKTYLPMVEQRLSTCPADSLKTAGATSPNAQSSAYSLAAGLVSSVGAAAAAAVLLV
ncbi:hypothetical protein DFS34DRAFT_630681 [Phlyctochytrium arcticum]|nr:hypothetical protein DFS34DRAFT_630681 [Phlyctochytrium arcticum]